MKIKGEAYQKIEQAMLQVMEKNPEVRAKYQAAGLSDTQYRWDMFWAARLQIVDPETSGGHPDTAIEVPGCSDAHIDTALRKITNTK